MSGSSRANFQVDFVTSLFYVFSQILTLYQESILLHSMPLKPVLAKATACSRIGAEVDEIQQPWLKDIVCNDSLQHG